MCRSHTEFKVAAAHAVGFRSHTEFKIAAAHTVGFRSNFLSFNPINSPRQAAPSRPAHRLPPTFFLFQNITKYDTIPANGELP